MGIRIIDKDKDFSSLGLGNVNPSETYIKTAGLTNETHKTAIRAFYNSFKNAGFFKKFSVARLYFTGTALGDSLNLVDPVTGAAAHQATFINDSVGRHTASGWAPDPATLNYANGNFALGADLKTLHMHGWNTTQETQGAGINKYLLGVQGGQFFLALQRNGAGKVRGAISISSTITFVQASAGSEAGLGLISVSRQANIAKLYSAGVPVNTVTMTDSPTATAASNIKEGTLDTAAAANFSTCSLRFLGYGFSEWTDADEAALNAMITAFNTAIA